MKSTLQEVNRRHGTRNDRPNTPSRYRQSEGMDQPSESQARNQPFMHPQSTSTPSNTHKSTSGVHQNNRQPFPYPSNSKPSIEFLVKCQSPFLFPIGTFFLFFKKMSRLRISCLGFDLDSTGTILSSPASSVPARPAFSQQNKDGKTGTDNSLQNGGQEGSRNSSFSGLAPDHPLLQLYRQRQRNRQWDSVYAKYILRYRTPILSWLFFFYYYFFKNSPLSRTLKTWSPIYLAFFPILCLLPYFSAHSNPTSSTTLAQFIGLYLSRFTSLTIDFKRPASCLKEKSVNYES